MSLNVLLTGGAGYIGSHVVNLLIEKGYSVTVVDNLITGNKKLISSSAEFEKCDISNVKKISRILKKKKFDIAMHFAGLVSVDESLTNPKKYIKYNYEKTKIFFNTCLKNGLKKIIFSSTASVYGNPNKYKVSERAKLNPQNPYAISKQKAEKYIIDQSKKFSLKYIILRYFNVAGADEKLRTGLISKQSTHLIKRICEVVTKKKRN